MSKITPNLKLIKPEPLDNIKLSDLNDNLNKIDNAVGKTQTYINGVADYTIKQGTSGIWTYKKYASGYAECWGTATGTIACDRKWGAFYTSGDNKFLSIRYPFTFINNNKLNVQITHHYGDGNYLLMTTSEGYDKSIYSPPVQIARGTSNKSVKVILNIRVIGQLK